VPIEVPSRQEIDRRAASRRAFWWLVATGQIIVSSLWLLMLFGVFHHPPALLVFLPFVLFVIPIGGLVTSVRSQTKGYKETPDPAGSKSWWVWWNRHPFLVAGLLTAFVVILASLVVFRG
jgi:hypothetical protein